MTMDQQGDGRMGEETRAAYTCSVSQLLTRQRRQEMLTLNIRGVNLGGWMIVSPGVNPSLFYQFENKDKDHSAMDMFSFCKTLGKREGNRQLREHWARWVTAIDLKTLATQGINAVRIPVGDWMWQPYEPYIGCTDGALEELIRVLHECNRLGLRVLIDLHGVRESQNGFDNSGHSLNVSWTSNDHFLHWPVRSANWQGIFDSNTMTYKYISWDNIRGSIQVLQKIALSLRSFPAVIGIEALNEPWQYTPLDVLRAFYWESYWVIRAVANHWIFVIHDSFRLDEWDGFMKGCAGVILDTHIYQAWFDIQSQQSFLDNACSWKGRIRNKLSLPVLVGEWSLATDNCNMWLNGFHDNAPGYPKVTCGDMVCPQPLVSNITGPPMGDALGPYGTGNSAPSHGRCPVSKPWDNEDEFEPELAKHKMSAFAEGVGWFYWNFKNELQPHWSWLESRRRNWLPKNLSILSPELLKVCNVDGAAGDSDPAATNDLPWFNALPTPRPVSSIYFLFSIGIGSMLAIGILLQVILFFFGSDNRRSTKLQLPPRLLHVARNSQRIRQKGVGPRGVHQRATSRSLSLFPLMHAIAETDDEENYRPSGSSVEGEESDKVSAGESDGFLNKFLIRSWGGHKFG